MNRITVKLSAAGIEQALQEIEEYKARVQLYAKELVRQLAEQGAQIALVETAGIHITGALQQGIHAESSGNIGYVKCSCGHAVYVEFGTGIEGERRPHPDTAILGWEYDVNGHGVLGWWYPSSEADPNPHKRRGSKGGWIAWTAGMPSRPFMYNTAQALKPLVITTARSVFQ